MFIINSGFVDVQNVEGYLPSYQKYSTKGKGQFFRQAVEKCDEFLKDPVVSIASVLFFLIPSLFQTFRVYQSNQFCSRIFRSTTSTATINRITA